MAKDVLQTALFKSLERITHPVIAPSLFREYDLRNPIKTLVKGGKQIPAAINEDGFFILGKAYGTYVQQTCMQKKVIVANDYRSYARGLSFAFITGLLSTGVDVIDIGTQLTPVMYYAQYHFNLLGGAMVTASHNDNGWTGLKVAKGLTKTFGPDDIIAFKKLVYDGNFCTGNGFYERIDDFAAVYMQQILATVRPFQTEKKLHVVISGGNGFGGFFLQKIVSGLGHTVIPVMNDLDREYPVVNPNPEHVHFLEILGKKVQETGADIGIGVDGDGDRVGVVDEQGKEISADRIGLLLAKYFVQREKTTNNKIVIDVKSTNAYKLDPVLTSCQTEIIFCKTGHSYVKAVTQEEDALAGFEKSGHFFLRGKYGKGYDDAQLAAAWIVTVLAASSQSLSGLLAEQPLSRQSPTLEPSVTNDIEKYTIVASVIDYFQSLYEQKKTFAGLAIEELITINGVRFLLAGGAWGVIRASSNQPNLVITCESFTSKRQMYDIVEAVQALLKQYDLGAYDQVLPPYTEE